MGFRDRHSEFFRGLDDSHWDPDRFVPAVGPEDADFVLIGEAPGENEVKQNEPFVGRAGQRLNEVLGELGVERSEVYITNLVKVRPPDNRNPTRDEIEAWEPLLDREIEEVQPETVVTLGNFPTRQMLGTSKGITDLHGKVHRREGLRIVPAFHPAATLYDQSKKPELVEDLKKAFDVERSQKKFTSFC